MQRGWWYVCITGYPHAAPALHYTNVNVCSVQRGCTISTRERNVVKRRDKIERVL